MPSILRMTFHTFVILTFVFSYSPKTRDVEPMLRHRPNKVNVQVYSIISSLKTYHPALHFTLWSLNMFIRLSFQLHREHTVLQPFRRIMHIAISVLPGTHFYLSQVKQLRVK